MEKRLRRAKRHANAKHSHWSQHAAHGDCLPFLSLCPAGGARVSDRRGQQFGRRRETEAERLYPIAAWLPIWVERQTIYEVALEENPRDEQALQHESGRLAMQKLLTFCGGSDEIIDKWLDYSMIEGGNIMAVATAEMQMEIGRFLPISPE